MAKKKRSKWFWIGIISLITVIIFYVLEAQFNFLTTTYQMTSEDGSTIVPPQTIEECHYFKEAIAVPLSQDCPQYYVEWGNSGTQAICCVPDNCQGKWERVYNPDTYVFDKVCKK